MNKEEAQLDKYLQEWKALHQFTVLLRDDENKVCFIAEEYSHVGGCFMRYVCDKCRSATYQFWPRGVRPEYLVLETLQDSHKECSSEPTVFHINSNSGVIFVKK